MNAFVQAPLDLLEAFSALRLPPKLDAKLQTLMDRNTDGQLTPTEREDLESLVEWSHNIALLRARALHVLGKRP